MICIVFLLINSPRDLNTISLKALDFFVVDPFLGNIECDFREAVEIYKSGPSAKKKLQTIITNNYTTELSREQIKTRKITSPSDSAWKNFKRHKNTQKGVKIGSRFSWNDAYM